MTQIMDLMERRAKAWDAAKKFLDAHSDNGGNVSEEDAATYDKMEKEVTDLTHDIERLQRQEQIEQMMRQPTSSPLTGKPGAGDNPDEKTGTASNAYKSAFWDSIRKRNWYDVKNVLEIGTDANGGYLVPDEYEKQLVQALNDENFFRSLAHVIQTQSGTHTIPVVASHGTAAWMDENGLRRIGAAEEEAFLTGDGKKKPEGVFTKVKADKDATTEIANTNISFDAIMDVFHSLRSVYRNRATWILNDSTVKALRKIKDNNGNYIWQPAVTAGQPDMNLNRPYKTSIYAPELAAGNVPLLFGDFSYYWIAERQGRSFKRLSELYAANGQIGFLASERVDGRLILPEAVRGLSIKASA